MQASGSREFDLLRDALAGDAALRTEFERALQVNIDRVNPSDRSNRFIFGGTVEWIVAAVAWEAGVLTVPGGHSIDGFDLIDLAKVAKGLWSVKTQSGRSPADFRISNGLGGAGKGLTNATIFLSPHLPGLVYLDPNTHLEALSGLEMKGDATILKHSALRQHVLSHPECVAPMSIPRNAGRGVEDPLLEYVKTVLVRSQFPRLSVVFRVASHEAQTIPEGIKALAELRTRGFLSEEEFEEAKAKLLASRRD